MLLRSFWGHHACSPPACFGIEESRMEPTMSFFSGFQPSDVLYLTEAAWRTLLISVLSISIGTFLGTIFG
jgi:ABC-type amino acid transport system permease subunit